MKFHFMVYILLFTGASLSAQHGIYRNSTDFLNGDLHLVGDLVEIGEDQITFKIGYSTLTYKVWEIWGFQDAKGQDYRSIDKQFYKIENNGPIWIFSKDREKEQIRLFSYGVNGVTKEFNQKNIMEAIEANSDLYDRYKAMGKSERKAMIEDVVESFNREYPNSNLSMNK